MARTQYPFEGRFAPRLRLVVEVRIGVITKRAIELSLRPPNAEVLTQAPAIRRTLSAKIVFAIISRRLLRHSATRDVAGLEAVFLENGHGFVECRFQFSPGADVAISVTHSIVFEYLLDGDGTVQPASFNHFLNNPFERMTLDAAVHRQRPTVNPIRRRSDEQALFVFIMGELSQPRFEVVQILKIVYVTHEPKRAGDGSEVCPQLVGALLDSSSRGHRDFARPPGKDHVRIQDDRVAFFLQFIREGW